MGNPMRIWCGVISLLLSVLATSPARAQDWTERNKGKLRPLARFHHDMVYDSVRQRTIMFGGFNNQAGFLDDTWEWDGNAWTQLKPGTRPPARAAHTMAYDSARQRVVLFGGTGMKGILSDTWEWDGTTWSLRAPVTIPPAAIMCDMAYNPVRKRTVFFGSNGDTWEWDGINWVKRQPVTNPAGRLVYAMAYDAARQRTVMFGGSHGTVGWSNEFWEWDGVNWTQRKQAVSPSGRHSHEMAYDAARKRIVLFAGDSFTWWQDDTWEWDGTNWTQRQPATHPSKRIDHRMVYDASRQRVVLFGGLNLVSHSHDDTWEYGFPAVLVPSGAARPGTTVGLDLTAANDAGLGYQTGSSLGTGPITLGTRKIYLGPDPLLAISVGGWWPSIFSGYQGVLDKRGQAQATIDIPNYPRLVGTRLHTAFVTLDPKAPSGIRSISNTETIVVNR